MTDENTTPETTDGVLDVDDFLDAWIDGGSTVIRSVVIHGRPGLFGEYQQLERDLEIARAAAKAGEELGGGEVRKLEARQQAIYDEVQAAKSIWYVRGMLPGDSDAIDVALAEAGITRPELEAPTEPDEPVLPPKATENQRKAHTIRMKEYQAEREAFDIAVDAYNAAFPAHQEALEQYYDAKNRYTVAQVLDHIEFGNGRRAESITAEQLDRMAKTFGARQVLKLVENINFATLEASPEFSAPFSRSTSEDDPT